MSSVKKEADDVRQRIGDFPKDTKLVIRGAEKASVWRVIGHITDEDGVVTEVKIVRDGKSLNGMITTIPAEREDFVIASSDEQEPIYLDGQVGEEDVSDVEDTPVVEEAPKKAPKKAPKEPSEENVESDRPKPGRKKRLLSTAEMSERTGVSSKDILAAISDKSLVAEKQGRTYVATIPDVDAWARSFKAAAKEKSKGDDKKVKAMKEITGKKDGVDFSNRGKHLKSRFSEIEIGSFKADPKNPCDPRTRMYGYFQAIVNGDGEASFGEMRETYLSHMRSMGIENPDETEEAVNRDLSNYISAWMSEKTGPRGLHIHVERMGPTGRLKKGERDQTRYRLIGFKEGSSYFEKAKQLGW